MNKSNNNNNNNNASCIYRVMWDMIAMLDVFTMLEVFKVCFVYLDCKVDQDRLRLKHWPIKNLKTEELSNSERKKQLVRYRCSF